MMVWRTGLVAWVCLAACSCSPTSSSKIAPGAVAVLPTAQAPTPFTRAYSLTESLDGQTRVFAQEDGDTTRLMVMYFDSGQWSAPEILDFPHRRTLTTPSFSFADGALHYSSDAKLAARPDRSDLNIWRAEYLGDGAFGEPEPLPVNIINTGANETSAAIARDGTMLFATNHSRAGGGGYDIMQAHKTSAGEWIVETLPKTINDPRTNDHLAMHPDGRWMVFYSHRAPKAGSVDIWRSNRSADGKWLPPFNLGEVVNTSAIEFGAGLSADAETFFFARDGALMKIPVSSLPSAAIRND